MVLFLFTKAYYFNKRVCLICCLGDFGFWLNLWYNFIKELIKKLSDLIPKLPVKNKIFKLSFLAIYLLAAVFGSTVYFYSPNKALAQSSYTPLASCEQNITSSTTQVDKSSVTKNSKLRLYASTVISPNVALDCSQELFKDKNSDHQASGVVIIFTFWSSTSSSASQIGWVAYDAKFNASLGPKGGFEAGGEIGLSGLPIPPEYTEFFVYANTQYLNSGYSDIADSNPGFTELDGSPIKVTIGTESNSSNIKQLNSRQVRNSNFSTNAPLDPDVDCSGSQPFKITTSKNDPIELYNDENLKVDAYTGLYTTGLSPEQLQQIRNCDSHKVSFVLLVKYDNSPQQLLRIIKAIPVKDSDGNISGWKGGGPVLIAEKLTAEQKASITNGGTIAAIVEVVSHDGDINSHTFEKKLGTFSVNLVNRAPGAPDHPDNNSDFEDVNSGFYTEEEVTDQSGFKAKEGLGVTLLDFLTRVIGTLFYLAFGLMGQLFSLIINPLIEAILQIRTYTDNFADVILPGWNILRNLTNIFFIIVLLVIGLGTLFRVSKYQYKNLLLKLILAALLVNFSLVITQSVLAVAETVQNQFLPLQDDSAAPGIKPIRVLAYALIVTPIKDESIFSELEKPTSASVGEALGNLFKPFFYLAMTIIAVIVMASLLFFLIVRIIVLWVLLMTSPLAFVAWILPDTAKWTKKWFNYLIEYAFFVAIMGFFLNIAAYMAQQERFLQAVPANLGNTGDFLATIARNFFTLGFLIAGIFFAKSSGVYGAKTMAKYAEAGGKLPFQALKAGAERTFEGVQNLSGLTLDPRIWKKDFGAYLKKREGEAEERLKNRKMGKNSLIGGMLGENVAKAIASPEQIYENFMTTQGWGKIPKKLLGKGVAAKREAKEAQALAVEANALLTDEEREKKQKEIDGINGKKALLDGKISPKSDQTKSLIDNIDAELKQLRDDELAGVTDSDRPEKIKKLLEAKNKIETMTGDADVNDLLTSVDSAVADRIKADVEAMKSEIKDSPAELDEEIAKIDKAMKEDNERRLKLGFSEYDKDKKTKDGSKYKEVNDQTKHGFSVAALEAKGKHAETQFKQVLKQAVEDAKEEQKIQKELDEKGVETPAEIEAEMRLAKGKKDEVLRIKALSKRAAGNGSMGTILQNYGFDQNAQGMQAFLDKMVGKNDKNNTKMVAAFAAELDKVFQKNKEHGLGNMTQRVGAEVVYRSPESHASAYGKAIASQNNTDFLRNTETSLFDISTASGREDHSLKPAAKKRLESMKAADAKSIDRNVSPSTAKKIVDQVEKKKTLKLDEAVLRAFKQKAG